MNGTEDMARAFAALVIQSKGVTVTPGSAIAMLREVHEPARAAGDVELERSLALALDMDYIRERRDGSRTVLSAGGARCDMPVDVRIGD